jgi:predicted transposase/invertase (TIGR01784 family)
MTELVYKFTNDALFKLFFVKFPDMLKRLVAMMLGLRLDSITEFLIINPDISPETFGDKFCSLDISMIVNGQRAALEVQVKNEGDYPERSLYYWARDFSTALKEGEAYKTLPRTIIISIIAFPQFPCAEFYSEYQVLEVKRHTPLTDRLLMIYFELTKLPEVETAEDELKLWLALFNAKTEEELAKIESLGGTIMQQAVSGYRHVTATDEFKEIERMRSRARHNEASALRHAKDEGKAEEREKWQGVVADKDTALANKDAEIARLRAQLESQK